MRYSIAAATVITLIVGVTLGFALTSTVFEAEAKPPPEVQPVEEQNVDGSGFIAVHEQGVADVNVVSMDSDPVGYRTLIGRLTNTSSTGWSAFPSNAADFDLDASLTALAADGWEVVHVVGGSNGEVVFTLARSAP